MCGQCGIFTNFITQGEMRFFKKMLLLNQDRGFHSTGIVAVTKAREETLKGGRKKKYAPQEMNYKEPRCAHDFLVYEDLDKKHKKKSIFDGLQKQLIFGHCRHATVGKINTENAHPFVAGDIVGVHNGTIKKDFEGSKDYETDSEAFFNLINKVGLKKALEEVESYSQTAYAIVYVHRKEGTLNIIRNADRPLKMAYNKNKNLLAWSSEGIDLLYAAGKTGQDFSAADIFEPKPYHHYAFKLTDTESYREPVITDLSSVKKTYTTTTYSYGGHNGYSSQVYGSNEYEDFYHKDLSNKIRFRVSKNSGNINANLQGSWTYIGWLGLHDEVVLSNHYKADPRFQGLSVPEFILNKMSRKQPQTSEKATVISIPESEIDANGHQVVFTGFEGKQYMKKDFEKIIADGCSMCQHQPLLTPGMDAKISWHDANTFFCEECTNHAVAAQLMIRWRMHDQQSEDI